MEERKSLGIPVIIVVILVTVLRGVDRYLGEKGLVAMFGFQRDCGG